VRAWFSGLDSTKERRNSQTYGVLSMICNSAVDDGLLERNPCMIKGAMAPNQFACKQVGLMSQPTTLNPHDYSRSSICRVWNHLLHKPFRRSTEQMA